MKTCTKCLIKKPLDQFGERKNRKNPARFSWCKTCVIKANKYDPEKARIYKLKNSFGITQEDYNHLYTKQGGVCAICGEPETFFGNGGKIKRLAVDHCHSTGIVRGLLCTKCNTALGKFNDNVSTLEKAIAYLKKEGI